MGSTLSILFEKDNKFYRGTVIGIDGNKYTLRYDYDKTEETMIRIGDNLHEWKSSVDQINHFSCTSLVDTSWRWVSEDDDNFELFEVNATVWNWE